MQDSSPVIWTSHRGYHQEHLENSKEAFDAAVAHGFTSLETDLHTSLDGVIVLHHDANLKRTFGRDLWIPRTNWKELRQLKGKRGETLLSLPEFIELYAGFNWVFDIKPESARRTLPALLQWLRQRQAGSWFAEQARFLFWHRSTELHLKQLLPQAKTLAREWECYQAGLSILGKMPWLGGMERHRLYSLPRYFAGRDLFQAHIVSAYHRRGAKLLAYLPETKADAEAALQAGFDEILTNHLPVLASSP